MVLARQMGKVSAGSCKHPTSLGPKGGVQKYCPQHFCAQITILQIPAPGTHSKISHKSPSFIPQALFNLLLMLFCLSLSTFFNVLCVYIVLCVCTVFYVCYFKTPQLTFFLKRVLALIFTSMIHFDLTFINNVRKQQMFFYLSMHICVYLLIYLFVHMAIQLFQNYFFEKGCLFHCFAWHL